MVRLVASGSGSPMLGSVGLVGVYREYGSDWGHKVYNTHGIASVSMST